MTPQEAFNAAYLGLKSQGFEKSYNPEGGVCRYRTNHGLKCAVGHCIPDELYEESFESKSAGHVKEILDRKSPLFCDIEYNFLKQLQKCHDNANDSAEMQVRFKDFARRNDLTIPE